MTTKAFIKKHPVPTFFTLTFAVSWGGIIILGAPYGMPTTEEQSAKIWPIVFLPYFLGPSFTCLLLSGLIVGILHGIWHFLPTFWASGDSSGALDLLLFLPPCIFYIGVLPAYRVLMVWVYDHTRSLLVGMLMHASLTAGTLFIILPSAKGIPLMIYYIILTVVMWVVVALVAASGHGRLERDTVGRTR